MTVPTPSHNLSTKGKQAEDLACRYLQERGLRLLERNYHCPCGEIDLVMQHGDFTVFVEVRFRSRGRFGDGIESIDRHKQARLAASALHYLQRNRRAARGPSRFDVVSVSRCPQFGDVCWIRNAFEVS